MRRTSWLLALLLVGAGGCAPMQGGPGSLAAKREVKAARLLAREVDAAVAQNQLRRVKESVSCDGGSVHMQATLFTDAAGRPRKYVLEGGSGDDAHYLFYYYDAAGKLRLIDSDQRAAKSSQRTAHIYFDTKGVRVHKDERTSGPKRAFPEAIERHDPAADLHSLVDPHRGCRRVPFRE